MIVKRALKSLLDLLFPVECLGCGKEGAWLCAPCRQGLPLALSRHCPFCERRTLSGETCRSCRRQRALDGALSCLPYAHPLIQALIHAWKYQGVRSLGADLAQFVNRGLQARDGYWRLIPLWQGDTVLVPIPLHHRRERERGFNQAEDLARALAAKSGHGWSVAPVVRRTRATTAQAKLAGQDRERNVLGAFALTAPTAAIKNKNFWLLDDVITTGQTCEAIARLLKDVGANSVWALTIAYGHPVRRPDKPD